ncbi:MULTISPECIES: glycosyltransferase family 2 protein [unclassified Brevundimonas]|uniref:glycosyltransferase family 2 protein n=1 Tax=unclassified Brevundimonas TaxID=2622653 RepID=UPI0025BD08EC|nr:MULTISPECIES: glycosyltransferase [unclassified Brevundimonas]
MAVVTVMIPTLRRLEALQRAVRSLFTAGNARHIARLVIVDNDPNASARECVGALTAEAPFPVLYVLESVAGVATARNTGLGHVGDSQFVAFLDDDEMASPDWLDSLCKVQLQTGADVVFGPIRGISTSADEDLKPMVEAFFSRIGPAHDGLIDHAYGCGNSMVRCAVLDMPDAFEIAANETGGEDDILFSRLKAKGCLFAWASQAWVEEHASRERSRLGYLLKRGFARGQGPSQTSRAERRWLALLGWMAVGAAQFAAFGLAALIVRPVSRSRGYALMLRASEGLGKVFWMTVFEPRLYGAALNGNSGQ